MACLAGENESTIVQNFGLPLEVKARTIYNNYMNGFNGLKAYQAFRRKEKSFKCKNTCVIECDLKDYSLLPSNEKSISTCTYTGTNISDLSFYRKGLKKLKQLCILKSHMNFGKLKKPIERKYEIYESISKDEIIERLKYQFEGICIQSDAYDSDGTELVKSGICTDASTGTTR